jgi:signal transduction histidine kinase/ActR/RegA family two-component response regulator
MMRTPLKVFLTSLFVLVSFFVFPQENKENTQDTTALIHQLQQNAYQAIITQDLDNVMPQLLRAKELANAFDDPMKKTLVCSTIAYFYYTIHSYDLAAAECAKAISYIKDEANSKELGLAYSLYGLISLKTNNRENAERYLERAERIFQSLNDEVELSKIKYKKGLFAYEEDNYQMALNYFSASLEVFEVSNIPFYESLANLYIAKSLVELQTQNAAEKERNIDRAKTSIDRAFDISTTKGYKKTETLCLKTYSEIAYLQGNTDGAYKALRSYLVKKDELEENHAAVLSKNLNFESNSEELNAIIASQQSDLDQQQRSISMNRITTGLSVALIIILSLLTLSLYKNNNLRAKANNLLQDKNDELLIAKEKAEKASLAKAQFLSTITHELRTPMYAVTGLTHLLLEDKPREDQKEHLNSLKFSGEYLLSLINNILDLNKLEANKVELEKKTFSLKNRVDDVLIALKKSALDRNNKLTLDYDDGIPPKLMGDPVVISQILINLVGNSVKFTENGKVTLRIKKLSQTDRSVLLHFEVEDTGVGISLKKQKAIFESFTQGSIQINRKFGGTGLGLSIVKNLLNLMDSKVHLESEIGKGSKFWFDLKLTISDEKPEPGLTEGLTQGISFESLENLNILVVEDNKINQMITKKILEKNKINCSVADNGEDAVKMAKENDYDLILMDIHMPGISGIEATQQIREFKQDIPIIALTAVTIDENLDDFYKAGFNEIIPKPFKTEEFFQKIYRTIQTQKVGG